MLAFVTGGSNGGGQNRQEAEDEDGGAVSDEILNGGDQCDPRSKLKTSRDSISTLV